MEMRCSNVIGHDLDPSEFKETKFLQPHEETWKICDTSEFLIFNIHRFEVEHIGRIHIASNKIKTNVAIPNFILSENIMPDT